MFQSEGGKNLLFKDSTKCLQDVQTDSYETFLGPEYMAAIHSLRQCSGTAPGLYNLESFYILIYVCTFSAFTVMLYVFFFLSDRSIWRNLALSIPVSKTTSEQCGKHTVSVRPQPFMNLHNNS